MSSQRNRSWLSFTRFSIPPVRADAGGSFTGWNIFGIQKGIPEKGDAAILILRLRRYANIDYQTPGKIEKSQFHSNMTRREFETAVRKAKEYIVAGDNFPVVLSQRFDRQTPVKPILIYRALRTITPSPYMFHPKLDDIDIIGASPELSVKVENNEIEVGLLPALDRGVKTQKKTNYCLMSF